MNTFRSYKYINIPEVVNIFYKIEENQDKWSSIGPNLKELNIPIYIDTSSYVRLQHSPQFRIHDCRVKVKMWKVLVIY